MFFAQQQNGPKDAKMWPLRWFALHPKDALPTNMGFHHSIIAVRILTGLNPNGSATHPMHKQHAHTTWNTLYAPHNTQHTTCNTQYAIHHMEQTMCPTQHAIHVMENTTFKNNMQRCVAIAPTVIGVSRRHRVLEVVKSGTVRILTALCLLQGTLHGKVIGPMTRSAPVLCSHVTNHPSMKCTL